MKDPRQEFDEELQFHLEERVRDYIARGMSDEEARRAATERIGDVESVRRLCASRLAAARAAEGRRRMLTVSWLDVKLGVRMFARYPGLSLVSVVGMALAIAISAGYFTVFGGMVDSTLPFDPEGRVVVVRMRTISGPGAGGTGSPSFEDYERWNTELRSIVDLSAFREESRNLITEDGAASPVPVAAISASGLQLTGVTPALGRTFAAADEHASAPALLLISFDEWQRRFNGDRAVIGQTVRLDETPHTIVGVMPDGFGFPVNHRYWVPLRRAGGGNPPVHVFGRIAGGLSFDDSRAEVAAVGERTALALPHTHKDVRPYVLRYTNAFLGVDSPAMEFTIRSLQFGVSVLLIMVAMNVAILVYARTATRAGEIAVRSALGASRARVVTQMFIEGLVPALVAAAVGLGMLSLAFIPFRDYLRNSPDENMPYWMTDGALSVSPAAMGYAAALATLAAIIIGVLPALKATARRVQTGLQQFSARGAGMRLGGTWTALIIVQVAVAVVVLPGAVHKAASTYRVAMLHAPPAAVPLLRASLVLSDDVPVASAETARSAEVERRAARLTAWIRTLEAEPGISAVTFADSFPGEEPSGTVDTEEQAAERVTLRAHSSRVATNFFEVLGVRVRAGRGFTASDATPGAHTVIVDQTFVERLGGANVLGRRIRAADLSPGGNPQEVRWFEVVGVVPSVAASFSPPAGYRGLLPRVYHAARSGDTQAAAVVLRVSGGDPAGLSQRLRAATAAVHPSLKLEQLESVVQAIDRERRLFRHLSLLVAGVTASVLLLSAAGIYALMSFTVAKRRREIGIRTALGADGRRVLRGIFGRSAAQVGAGVVIGLTIASALERLSGGDFMGGNGRVVLPAVATLMFTTGVLAALGPARRGLAVHPTEALREE